MCLRKWVPCKELSEYTYNKARAFARDRYAEIKRKDDKSMFSHVQAVVKILIKHKIYNKHILTIAYLHDIFEETKTSKKEILDNFGAQVLKDILSLTVIKRHEEKYNSQFRRMFKKLQLASKEALIVKLADRLHNLECMARSPRYFKKEKIERYKISTEKLVIGLFQKKLKHKKLILEVLDLCK
jgi:(p)ppGpp synthase/HD superfamily hydrolase